MIRLPRLNNLFPERKRGIYGQKPPLFERRKHARFKTDIAQVCTFKAYHRSFDVIDISYGGLRLPVDPTLISREKVKGEINILGDRTALMIKPVHNAPDNKSLGYCILHKDNQALSFLRKHLTYLQAGSTLQITDPEILSEAFKKKYNVCMRGDGPVELFIGYENSQLKTAFITFLSGDYNGEIKWNGSEFTTSYKTADKITSAEGTNDHKIEHTVIKQGIMIIAGALPKWEAKKEDTITLAIQNLLEKLLEILIETQKSEHHTP